MFWLRRALFLSAALWLAACGHAPPRPGVPPPSAVVPTVSDNSLAAEVAASMIGKPYRAGGMTPGEGFDCSGLVHYAYSILGVDLPRTAATQRSATSPVSAGNEAVGDLLFFRLGRGIDHVGIYYGDGHFVHAPSRGKTVTLSRLDESYWRQHLAGVGRPVPVFQ